jgi:hypothetical protein
MAQGLSELWPEQRTERITTVLSANPSILDDLGRHLIGRGPAQLREPTGRRVCEMPVPSPGESRTP